MLVTLSLLSLFFMRFGDVFVLYRNQRQTACFRAEKSYLLFGGQLYIAFVFAVCRRYP